MIETTGYAELRTGHYEDITTRHILSTIRHNKDCATRVAEAIAPQIPTPTASSLKDAVREHVYRDVIEDERDEDAGPFGGGGTLARHLVYEALDRVDWSYIWDVVAKGKERRTRPEQEQYDSGLERHSYEHPQTIEDANARIAEMAGNGDGHYEGAD